MPSYQYHCDACGGDFSARLKVSERNTPIDNDCPLCDSRGHVKMLIGTPQISYSTNPGMTTSDNFNARLQEIKKDKGDGCTIETRSGGI